MEKNKNDVEKEKHQNEECGCGHCHVEHDHGKHGDEHGHSHSHGCPCCSHGDDDEEEESKYIVPRLIAGAVIFVAAFVMSKIGTVPTWAVLATSIVAYAIVGCDIVWKAAKNIIHGEVFDECFLMSISSLGAFALGEYVEAVAVMLLYQFGEWLSDLAVNRSRDSISSLMNIRPDTAHIVKNGETVDWDRPRYQRRRCFIRSFILDGAWLQHTALGSYRMEYRCRLLRQYTWSLTTSSMSSPSVPAS